MSLQSEHTLHPITALDFFREQDGRLLLLAGEGPYLKVFEADTSPLVRQHRVFEGQTIHGITIQQDVLNEDGLQAVIWGGSSISMLTKRDLNHILQTEASISYPTTTVSDWILDVTISPYKDRSCVLITAHNTVLRANLGASNSIKLEDLHSPSRSILYSAHLLYDSSDEILVAAGTVFGEIIAWKCTIPKEAAQSRGEILFTFLGHEGSIFGVNISPPITFGDGSTNRLLASCSDDRSIRIWDLLSVSNIGKEDGVVAFRETGFGNDDAETEDRCLATAMGHASRIWQVKFLVEDSQIPNSIDILSFGEDSTTQQWSLKLKPAPDVSDATKVEVHTLSRSGQLQHRKTFGFHNGKHINSAAIRNIGAGQTLIATGGADGKISMYPIKMSEQLLHLGISMVEDGDAMTRPADNGVVSSIWNAEEVLGLLPSIESSDTPLNAESVDEVATEVPTFGDGNVEEVVPVKKKKAKKVPKDTFARYAFTSENMVVATTTFGRVLSGEIKGGITWTEMSLPASGKDDLRSWSVIKGVPEAALVYLAGTNGKIYGSGNDNKLVEVGSVDGKVADMFVVSDPTTAHSELLVSTLAGSTMRSFAIDRASKSPSFEGSFMYELPPKFVVTSAGGLSSNFLVLGSRYGSLAIYSHDGQLIQLEDSHSSLNGDAITSIIPMPCGQGDRLYFLVTGRKGAYSIFAFNAIKNLDGSPSLTNLSLIHQGSPPFGPMIEKAWFSGSDLILYGFKSKNFIVWNETRQYEIMSVECGGAHRSYAYSPTHQGGHLIYTKALQLHLHSQPFPSHKIIKYGGHGREIKTCAVSEDQTLFATGAEDTAIRIWSYTTQPNCLAVVQKHTAGIQHLQWYKSDYLFSSGGAEEFFVWAVEKLPSSGIGIMCEASRPDLSPDADLRIMNFDVTALPSPPESINETIFLISLAYSDSTIRVYTYSKTAKYKLIAYARYTSSCLLQIKHLRVTNTNDFMLLTAATDGNITLWECDRPTQSLLQISTQKIHQSSIKTLDIAAHPSYTIIATGGDDNALAISLFNLADSTKAMRVFMLRKAHGAAITGLAFIPDVLEERKGNWRIVTSSNDQRVKEWEISIDGERDVRIRKVRDVFTPVADVGDVACLRSGEGEKKVLVGVGNGMEVWRAGGGSK